MGEFFRFQKSCWQPESNRRLNNQMNHNLLPFLRSCRSLIIISVLLTARHAGICNPIPAPLTIQIVNDSGLSDTNIYIMVPGASGAAINPQSLFVDKNNGSATAVALSTLAGNGSAPPFQMTSPISGNPTTVYSLQATNISSGAIYFIYNHPFAFDQGTTPSPAPDGGERWQRISLRLRRTFVLKQSRGHQ